MVLLPVTLATTPFIPTPTENPGALSPTFFLHQQTKIAEHIVAIDIKDASMKFGFSERVAAQRGYVLKLGAGIAQVDIDGIRQCRGADGCHGAES